MLIIHAKEMHALLGPDRKCKCVHMQGTGAHSKLERKQFPIRAFDAIRTSPGVLRDKYDSSDARFTFGKTKSRGHK